MKEISVADLERIIESILETVEKARREIYDIANEAWLEYQRIKGELEAVKEEARAMIFEVESLEREERMARIRLMEVSRNFKDFTEEDIKEAYDKARDLQVKLSVLREKERSLIKRRNDLEMSLKRMEEIARKAEGFVDQVSMVIRMLKGHAETMTVKLKEAEKRQQLGLWIVQAQEEERRRIARELHDGPAQSLSNLAMRLDFIERLWEKDVERARQELAELRRMVKESMADIRRVIFDLRPMALDDLGLVPALRRYLIDYGEKHGMNLEFLFFGEEKRLSLPLEVAVFRMIQEAVSNVRKHAGVNEAQVKLEIRDDYLTAVVKDEGCGFDYSELKEKKGSYGLLGMQERVELFGGKLTVKSKPGQGTRVVIHLPFKERKGL